MSNWFIWASDFSFLFIDYYNNNHVSPTQKALRILYQEKKEEEKNLVFYTNLHGHGSENFIQCCHLLMYYSLFLHSTSFIHWSIFLHPKNKIIKKEKKGKCLLFFLLIWRSTSFYPVILSLIWFYLLSLFFFTGNPISCNGNSFIWWEWFGRRSAGCWPSYQCYSWCSCPELVPGSIFFWRSKVDFFPNYFNIRNTLRRKRRWL